jgi:CMP-N,N'-diacetyllegionaminic acid synthase
LFKAIAVSSDSDAILDAASAAGATVLVKRPAALATDAAAKLPVIQHCFQAAEAELNQQFDFVVDLDATSPLRTASDIILAHQLLVESTADNVFTVMPARRSPYFNLVELNDQGFAQLSKPPSSPIFSRQASPACYDINGSVYVWRRESLLRAETALMDRTLVHIMPEERSIDIDTELDFRFVEYLMSHDFFAI